MELEQKAQQGPFPLFAGDHIWTEFFPTIVDLEQIQPLFLITLQEVNYFICRDSLYCVTWVNIFEYLRAVTHRRLIRPVPLPIHEALENIRNLLNCPQVSRIDPEERHLEIFADICRKAAPVEGNFVHDCRIAAIMRENGVSNILTRDTSFRRIPGIKVVDPF